MRICCYSGSRNSPSSRCESCGCSRSWSACHAVPPGGKRGCSATALDLLHLPASLPAENKAYRVCSAGALRREGQGAAAEPVVVLVTAGPGRRSREHQQQMQQRRGDGPHHGVSSVFHHKEVQLKNKAFKATTHFWRLSVVVSSNTSSFMSYSVTAVSSECRTHPAAYLETCVTLTLTIAP